MIKKWYIDLIKNKKRILVATHGGVANKIGVSTSLNALRFNPSILRLPAYARASARQALTTLRAFRDVVLNHGAKR